MAYNKIPAINPKTLEMLIKEALNYDSVVYKQALGLDNISEQAIN